MIWRTPLTMLLWPIPAPEWYGLVALIVAKTSYYVLNLLHIICVFAYGFYSWQAAASEIWCIARWALTPLSMILESAYIVQSRYRFVVRDPLHSCCDRYTNLIPFLQLMKPALLAWGSKSHNMKYITNITNSPMSTHHNSNLPISKKIYTATVPDADDNTTGQIAGVQDGDEYRCALSIVLCGKWVLVVMLTFVI